MEFSWCLVALLLIIAGTFADLSKSTENEKIEPKPKLEKNQKENPPTEKEGRRVQPNIILVLVSPCVKIFSSKIRSRHTLSFW